MDDARPGAIVKVTRLETTTGMMISEDYLNTRKLGAVGMVNSYVPGHGGDVWFVRHVDGKIAAYGLQEMTEVDLSSVTREAPRSRTRGFELPGGLRANFFAIARTRGGITYKCYPGLFVAEQQRFMPGFRVFRVNVPEAGQRGFGVEVRWRGIDYGLSVYRVKQWTWQED